jgi:hypothetical protein
MMPMRTTLSTPVEMKYFPERYAIPDYHLFLVV